jgi:hypothetical protein
MEVLYSVGAGTAPLSAALQSSHLLSIANAVKGDYESRAAVVS